MTTRLCMPCGHSRCRVACWPSCACEVRQRAARSARTASGARCPRYKSTPVWSTCWQRRHPKSMCSGPSGVAVRRARRVVCTGWHRRRGFFAEFAAADQLHVPVTAQISLNSLVSPGIKVGGEAVVPTTRRPTWSAFSPTPKAGHRPVSSPRTRRTAPASLRPWSRRSWR